MWTHSGGEFLGKSRLPRKTHIQLCNANFDRIETKNDENDVTVHFMKRQLKMKNGRIEKKHAEIETTKDLIVLSLKTVHIHAAKINHCRSRASYKLAQGL